MVATPTRYRSYLIILVCLIFMYSTILSVVAYSFNQKQQQLTFYRCDVRQRPGNLLQIKSSQKLSETDRKTEINLS